MTEEGRRVMRWSLMRLLHMGRLCGNTGFFASTESQKDIFGDRRRQRREYEDIFTHRSSIFKNEKKRIWGTFKTLSQVPIGGCDKVLFEYTNISYYMLFYRL